MKKQLLFALLLLPTFVAGSFCSAKTQTHSGATGSDNGDATSFESFLGKQHKAFNGMALVIVRSKAGSAGK